MSKAITICHSDFGRLNFYQHDRARVLHTNRDGQLLFLISGDALTCTVNDEPIKLSQECAIAIDSFSPHEIKTESSADPVVMLSVYLNPMWFAARFFGHPEWLQFPDNRVPINDEIQNHLDHLLALLQPPTPDKQPGYHFALENRVLRLLQECFLKPMGSAFSEHVASRFESIDTRVRKSLLIMNNHVRDVLSLDEIARAAGLSRPHFYRLFRENLGVTPNVYMNMLRMEYAIERLVFSDQPVTSIALELGFASQASFTRFFGANLGVPPTDYRRVATLPSGYTLDSQPGNDDVYLRQSYSGVRSLGSVVCKERQLP